MYHSISDDKMEGVHPYFETNTSPTLFAEHMKYLYSKGYKVINLEDVREYLEGKKIAEKTVIITFDDGFRDFYTQAFPILQLYGFSATIFLTTGFISNKRLEFKGKECLTWKEVLKLNIQGIVFGSHTVNHKKLQSLNDIDIEWELKQSKEHIEVNTGRPVVFFSYPFAFPEEDNKFKKTLKKKLRKCEYRSGVTTKIGRVSKGDDLFFMRRIPINSFDDLNLFEKKINGLYDWVAFAQSLYKKIKNKVTI